MKAEATIATTVTSTCTEPLKHIDHHTYQGALRFYYLCISFSLGLLFQALLIPASTPELPAAVYKTGTLAVNDTRLMIQGRGELTVPLITRMRPRMESSAKDDRSARVGPATRGYLEPESSCDTSPGLKVAHLLRILLGD